MATIEAAGTSYRIIDLPGQFGPRLLRLPIVLRLLLENVLRQRQEAKRDAAVA